MRVALILALITAGCGAQSVWYGLAAEDSWTTPPGIPVQLRVSKFGHDHPGEITVVSPSMGEAPSGPAVANTQIPVVLDGVACTVSVLGRTTQTVERSLSTAEEARRPNAPAGTRVLQFLSIEIACGAHPVPGTDASLRGAGSRYGMLWALAILALAITAGELARRRKLAPAVIVGALAFAASIALPVALFDGLFRVTYAIAFAHLVLGGIVAMRGDSMKLRIATVVGIVIGSAIAPLIWPTWIAFGPIMALAFAALVGAVAAMAVVLKE